MDLTLRLIQAKQVLASELNELLAEFDMTTRSWWVLSKAKPGVLTQRELSERCEIDKTTIGSILDGFEERGLVRRTRAATDRRAWVISLTDRGRELLDQVQPIVERVEARAVAVIPPPERDAFIAGLGRLAQVRQAQLAKSSEN